MLSILYSKQVSIANEYTDKLRINIQLPDQKLSKEVLCSIKTVHKNLKEKRSISAECLNIHPKTSMLNCIRYRILHTLEIPSNNYEGYRRWFLETYHPDRLKCMDYHELWLKKTCD
jgi:hypothetical protein